MGTKNNRGQAARSSSKPAPNRAMRPGPTAAPGGVAPPNKKGFDKKDGGKKHTGREIELAKNVVPAELLDAETPLKERVLGYFKLTPFETYNINQVAAALQLSDAKAEVQQQIDQLLAESTLEEQSRGRYRMNLIGKTLEGRIEIFKDGHADIHVSELPNPLKISTGPDLHVLNGDIVSVEITESHTGKVLPKVTGVIKPHRTEFVGTVVLEGVANFFVPQDNRVKIDFRILNKDLNGADDGQKVVAEHIGWQGSRPIARVVRVLGNTGEHKAEMHAIIMEFNLPTDFPEDVVAESERIPAAIPADEIARRRDMRTTPTFTIDPVDAKDFDDALSIRPLAEGRWEIGVHIADVSYYVRPGTALDREAIYRATSVYLVDRTIPMLPERLSNDLCSLRPDEDRLAFSVIYEMDENGKIYNEWYGRTVIRSARRFSYEEVQEILDGKAGDHADELHLMNKIAYALRAKRFAEGSISFETEEVKFRLDEKGDVIELYVKARKDAHKMIEDFMLQANRSVARFVHDFRKPPPPMVYRVHARPDAEKLASLQLFVKQFGYELNLEDQDNVAVQLNALSTAVEGKPEQNIVQSVAIRTMPKAIYTIKNVGHYALGFKYYSHFTSPIRRYPDVLVHRILQMALDNELRVNAVELEDLCRKCSQLEKRASDAERASVKYKQVEFLTKLIGQEFYGVIGSLTNWGMYVELEENKCEGMIPLRDLPQDFYEFDSHQHSIRGKKMGLKFALGQRIRVRVMRADPIRRTVDFRWVKQ
jgi:ribonuclease R